MEYTPFVQGFSNQLLQRIETLQAPPPQEPPPKKSRIFPFSPRRSRKASLPSLLPSPSKLSPRSLTESTSPGSVGSPLSLSQGNAEEDPTQWLCYYDEALEKVIEKCETAIGRLNSSEHVTGYSLTDLDSETHCLIDIHLKCWEQICPRELLEQPFTSSHYMLLLNAIGSKNLIQMNTTIDRIVKVGKSLEKVNALALQYWEARQKGKPNEECLNATSDLPSNLQKLSISKRRGSQPSLGRRSADDSTRRSAHRSRKSAGRHTDSPRQGGKPPTTSLVLSI